MDAVIQNRIRNNCSNIINTSIKYFSFLTKYDIYIAGGAIRELYRNKPVNDYDIYFRTKKLAKQFIEQWVDYLPSKGLTLLAITKNAITLQLNTGEKVQFITRDIYCGRPWSVIHRFDFTHSMCYFHNDGLELRGEMIEACNKNLLVYNVSCFYPINTIKRTIKFMLRGWGIGVKQSSLILFSALKDIGNYKELGNSSY